MKITGSYFDPLRPTPTTGASSSVRSFQDTSAVPAVGAVKSDSVQISEAARRMIAEQADAMSPERIAEIRQKVLTGAYNTLDVVDQVARRIITRGDL
jgi:anti-sigma28 factor (negative regulator of flagellin synthesis)